MKLFPCLLVALLPATSRAQDPAPEPPPNPVRLVYEMPMDALQRSLKDRRDMDLEQLLTETVANVTARLQGAAKVARSEATMFTVDLDDATRESLELARQSIEVAGKFEQRVIVYPDYEADGVAFDIAEEKKRLLAWLDAGNRAKLQQDPRAIDAFHRDRKHGPVAGGNLRWFVRRIQPWAGQTGSWNVPLSLYPPLNAMGVAVYAEADWNGGAVPPHFASLPIEQRFLVELIPVNMHEVSFAATDLDPDRTQAVKGWINGGAVDYAVADERAADYAAFTGRHLTKCCVMLWEDEILSAPMLLGHAAGRMEGMTELQAEVMVRAMRAPLVVVPRLIRLEPR